LRLRTVVFPTVKYFMHISVGCLALNLIAYPIAPDPLSGLSLSPKFKQAPKINVLLNKKVYKRVVKDRDVMTFADLYRSDEIEKIIGKKNPNLKDYRFYVAVMVGASIKLTYEMVKKGELYEKLIPFVDSSKMNEKTGILDISGGIWKYKLKARIKFSEQSKTWIQFRVIEGHFLGMTGDIVLEKYGERGTVIYLGGKSRGDQWPPAFVLEEGAPIVLSLSARKMRSYIEEMKKSGWASNKSQKKKS